MNLPRRKWLFTVHFASGHKHSFVASDLQWRQDKNVLIGLTVNGQGNAWDYIRLDSIELIKSRRCWLRWTWSIL
jgi:hypothetical protein